MEISCEGGSFVGAQVNGTAAEREADDVFVGAFVPLDGVWARADHLDADLVFFLVVFAVFVVHLILSKPRR